MIDQQISIILNHLLVGHSNALDLALSMLATNPIFGAATYVAILWSLWMHNKTPISRLRIVSGVLALLTATIAAGAFRYLVHIHGRPLIELSLTSSHALGYSLAAPDGTSMPSGHALILAGLATVVLLENRKLGVLCLLWCLFVNLIRVALGIHYASDVLTGMVIGFVAVLCVLLVRIPGSVVESVNRFCRSASPVLYFVAAIGAYELSIYLSDAQFIHFAH
jgi:membrane-associated phospholipid phosphatase